MKIVVLSGAGMSAESGIATFRGAGGLWEGHRVEDVATPEAWQKNPELVLQFYNERREKIRHAQPNKGHTYLAEMEKEHEVFIITQNIDDLHERAGSTQVLHLHGEIMKSRSEKYTEPIYDQPGHISTGDLCERGTQLRPHIVWFGEPVPMMEPAIAIVSTADLLLITGTSLVVYPAASLWHYAPAGCPVYLVDPNPPAGLPAHVRIIRETAVNGIQLFRKMISHGT